MSDEGRERLRASKRGENSVMRRPEVVEKIRRTKRLRGSQTGPNHPKFKGEWVYKVGDVTRVKVWIGEEMRRRLHTALHHAARSRVNWLLAHPGETLTSKDVIHHIDENPMNDDPSNLQKFSGQAAHARYHDGLNAVHPNTLRGLRTRERLPDTPCEVCGKPKRPWRRFCSVECTGRGQSGSGNPMFGKPATARAEARRRQRAPDKPCEVCGAAVRPWRRFCSSTCSAKGLSGSGNGNAGRPPSEAQREAVRRANQHRIVTPEYREKMRQASLRRWARQRADG